VSKWRDEHNPEEDDRHRDNNGNDNEKPGRDKFTIGESVHDGLIRERELLLVAMDGIDGQKGDDEADDKYPVKYVCLSPLEKCIHDGDEDDDDGGTHILRGLP